MNDEEESLIDLHDCVFIHEIRSAQVTEAVPGPAAPPGAIGSADQFMAERPHMLVFCGREVHNNHVVLPLLFRPSDMASLMSVMEDYQRRLNRKEFREFRRRVDEWEKKNR